MRADFLRFYGSELDDVSWEDVWPLAENLPRGSATMSAIDPSLSWTDTEYLLADVYDAVNQIAAGLAKRRAKLHRRPKRATRAAKKHTHAALVAAFERDMKEVSHGRC